MSKHETWRTRQFWRQTGGLLIEEFLLVEKKKNQAQRLLDGLIVLNEEHKIHDGNTFDIRDKDVIVIQTKRTRLGMYLLGQAYFSKLLVEKLKPRSVRSVAVCERGDDMMEKLASAHGVEVVVIKDENNKGV